MLAVGAGVKRGGVGVLGKGVGGGALFVKVHPATKNDKKRGSRYFIFMFSSTMIPTGSRSYLVHSTMNW